MNIRNWSDKKVLICGGAGMIGNHLARTLLDMGAMVIIADNLSSGSMRNIDDVLNVERGNAAFFVKADLRDASVCNEIVVGKEAVFQLAANMGGIGYITSVGADIMRDSALININMLEAAAKNRIPNYFYSSSACVYPEHYQLDPQVKPLKESDAVPANPDQFYGWEKLFTEKLCESYQRDHDMNIRVARFHNVYGSAYTAFDKFKGKAPAHLIIKAIKHPDPPFEIWGDGEATRSFLHIDDCINGVLQLMGSDYTKPINIGSDRLITINDLARIIIEISGKDIKPSHDLNKPQGVRGRNADLTLVKKAIKWQPIVDLEEGLSELYAWAIQNYSELEGI